MDLGSLRSLVVGLNFAAHGIPIVVSPADASEDIDTRGIWLTPEPDELPPGLELRRREPSRILAIPTADVSAIPHGSIVLAPLTSGGTILAWAVDGFDRIEAEHTRVRLVPTANPVPPVPYYTNEIPAGVIDGSNDVFTLAHVYAPGDLNVVKNGLALTPDVDYTETGPREITFTIPPQVGDSIIITRYRGI